MKPIAFYLHGFFTVAVPIECPSSLWLVMICFEIKCLTFSVIISDHLSWATANPHILSIYQQQWIRVDYQKEYPLLYLEFHAGAGDMKIGALQCLCFLH